MSRAGLRHIVKVLKGSEMYHGAVAIDPQLVKYKLPDPNKLFALGEAISLQVHPKSLEAYGNYCKMALEDYEEVCKSNSKSALIRLLVRTSARIQSGTSTTSASAGSRSTPEFPPYFFMDAIFVHIVVGETLLAMYDLLDQLSTLEERRAPGRATTLDEAQLLAKIDRLISQLVVKPVFIALNDACHIVLERERDKLTI